MRGFKRGLSAVLAVLALMLILFGIEAIKPTVTVLVEGAERMRLQRLTTGYTVKETEDFVIRFSAGDVGVVGRVEDQAKRQLNQVSEYFGYKPGKKIYLTVYHDRDYLQKGLRLPCRGTTLGAYYAGTISVLSPNVWGDEGDEAEEGLYIHELTHLIMADMAGGNYPMWFTEGMALYQEYLNTGFEWGKEYIFRRMPYSLDELTDNFAGLDQYLAYKQSFLLVKTLVEREGRDKTLELFQALKENTPFDEAFRKVFGYLPEDLYGFAGQLPEK
ncbi:MAG: peptidase MA family metallohydrolase [Bacillota bacterium]|nr:peptidase MA family metallohydrolase [Bacillota bacterium]MDD3297992.1 peptidase MA family metallohydrolase [Bacillota bacterium]MDD3850023.1 peptidase MA family metallohydrolase [Bacillota bacterium]MDD4706740.1 peptidase MA family metallohydrolase [Bacillota bacterium]